uniref:(northern house mosquito) hypothetical protein n=1 Tax=Culex pipiens TaxID=7175 RepID=A0A8D8C355_CULPI
MRSRRCRSKRRRRCRPSSGPTSATWHGRRTTKPNCCSRKMKLKSSTSSRRRAPRTPRVRTVNTTRLRVTTASKPSMRATWTWTASVRTTRPRSGSAAVTCPSTRSRFSSAGCTSTGTTRTRATPRR